MTEPLGIRIFILPSFFIIPTKASPKPWLNERNTIALSLAVGTTGW